MIKIEKNVPIANDTQGRPRNTEVIKYDDAINSMEVGDSFEVCSFREITHARNSIVFNTKNNFSCRDKRFTTRKTGNHLNIYRVWRTAWLFQTINQLKPPTFKKI